MKPLTKGLLLGSATTLLAVLTVSATSLPSIIRVIITESVKVDGIFNPHTVVWVDEGVPYTVPLGKLLVITGGGKASWDFTGDGVTQFSAPLQVLVDGVEIYKLAGGGFSTPGPLTNFPLSGLVASENSVVTFRADTTYPTFMTGKGVGYLIDA